MKVVILAGGRGTRLSEETVAIPKPMVQIGGRPIIWHIMSIYAAQGFSDFVVALGYKGYLIKEYFANFRRHQSDFTVDLASGRMEFLTNPVEDWSVTLVDTGLDTMTGGRLRRLRHLLDGRFLVTYGDGLADVDLQRLLSEHDADGRTATVTAVHSEPRFGALTLHGSRVDAFREKPEGHDGRINGGFFVMEPAVLDLIEGDTTVLEASPLATLANRGELGAYLHDGFWKPMDTLRDRDELQAVWDTGQVPWLR